MRDLVAAFIDALLPREHELPELRRLYAMMRDYPSRPGKLLRGSLALASAEAHGADPRAAVPLAAALELFQNWVLVHDDIEDDSEERRGRPALHRLHGVPLALNAGDALHVYMWQAVLEASVPGAAAEFVETIHRTAEGQHLDLSWVAHGRWDLTEADYVSMVERKTARYTVVAPLRLGALAAGRAPDPRLERAGLDLGIAFQVRDDVLNLDGDRAAYGKEILGDLQEGKRTLALLHLLGELGPAERDGVIAVLERPRHAKSMPELERIARLMRERGSVALAQAVADRFAERGLGVLREALADLPGREAAQRILETARTLATRHA